MSISIADYRLRSAVSIIVLLVFCAASMTYAAEKLLTIRSAFELYPILFLPLFFSTNRAAVRNRILYFLPGTVFILSGIWFHRLSLIWIGSFWNALATLHGSGIRFTWPAPLLVFAVPPITGFGSLFVGYKLRLIVTEIAAHLIRRIDSAATEVGNRIFFDGHWFVVDRACEGLKMGLATALIAAAFALRSNRTGKILVLGTAFPLWFFSNLLRVCTLVVFQVPSSSWRHEFLGIVYFVAGVLIPLSWIVLFYPAKKKSDSPEKEQTHRSLVARLRLPSTSARILIPFLTALVVIGTRWIPIDSPSWPSAILSFRLDRNSLVDDPRIAVYRSGENYLILKRNLFAVGTGHDPRICFEAVGFAFAEQNENGGFKRARLQSPSGAKPILYWWYSISKDRVLSDTDLARIGEFPQIVAENDWQWRKERFLGADVIQWNLYGPKENELMETARHLTQNLR
ncbi:exosortase N [Leptospira gomenensis]|uniref:Exosortase N n=1 Tax=Leptospira gomenensis TaxID=2484974 RepID=A0A5F1YC55_9LEPT|nr:exosortase N [Leptospira gomenensis]TGK34531.1 exosortase N [Leptospira gomenensis]TGK40159.1 exosortase N [Leptospira gomenensis]TGK41916.1 exosortase N [Leptospira gomenensis]TGK55668.1 exosortase N [Leptospira gomenensis]